jgi:hypothetical protein
MKIWRLVHLDCLQTSIKTFTASAAKLIKFISALCSNQMKINAITDYNLADVAYQIAFLICFFLAEADSLFPNGKLLVRLSAPVFLLICPPPVPNRTIHLKR